MVQLQLVLSCTEELATYDKEYSIPIFRKIQSSSEYFQDSCPTRTNRWCLNINWIIGDVPLFSDDDQVFIG